MNTDLLNNVAWIGHNPTKEIRGIVFRFAGLGGTNPMHAQDDSDTQIMELGGLSVCPYYNPWAWMSPKTVDFIDDLIDAIHIQYELPKSTPIISTGGSMGGHAALTFTLKSRHTVSRCLANCPVCDLVYHYNERADLPRTFHSAFDSYGDITQALVDSSPINQADKLPRIPYLIIHGGADKAVSKERHSDKLCAQMREVGHDLTYIEVPEMGHCGPMDGGVWNQWLDFQSEGLQKVDGG